MAEIRFIDILQKMMALHAWDSQQRPNVESPLVSLLLEQETTGEAFKQLEVTIKEALEKPFSAVLDLPDETPEGINEQLYERLRTSRPLCEKLVEEPLLSSCDNDMLPIAVRLADVAPNQDQTMMDSSDALFLRILERTRQEPVTAEQLPQAEWLLQAERLLQEDLALLIDLNHQAPNVVAGLAALAAGPGWQRQIESLERALENSDPPPELDEQVAALVKMIHDLEASYSETTTNLLLSDPRLSAMHPQLVAFMAQVDPDETDNVEALETLKEKQPVEINSLIRELNFRMEAARHFLRLRKFAKLDTLNYKWPDLYRRFNLERSAVVQFEQYVNEPEDQRDEPELQSRAVQRLLEAYGQDEDLMRFLQLRPLLDEIYQDERERYQHIQVQAAAPERVRPRQETVEQAAVKGVQDSQALYSSEIPEPVLLRLDAYSDSESSFNITLSHEGNTVEGTSEVDWQTLRSQETKLLVRADTNDPLEGRLRQLGRWMYFELFPYNIQNALIKALEQGTNSQAQQRVIFQISGQELNRIPWESLFVPPPVNRLIFASSHFSALRHAPEVETEPIYPDTLPLRVLVLIQAPTDNMTVYLDEERKLVERMMDDPSHFQMKFLENASWKNFREELAHLFPQVVHIVAPTIPESSEEYLHFTFVNESNKGDYWPAWEVSKLMRESQVKLVTLSPAGTPTRTMELDERIINAAAGLAEAGVPAVVAPTRTGIASLPFHRTLYESIASGKSVEAAVLAGRRALKTENQPWIRYALFAGTEEPVRLIA